MEYMESKMQDQIEGSIALQNAICDDACDIYKETGIVPMEMKAQRDELLDALQLADAMLSGANMNKNVVEKRVKAAINNALGEKQ